MDVKLFTVNMVLEADIVLGRFAAAALPSARAAEDGGNRALNAGNYRNTHTTAITVLKCGHSGKMKFLLGVNETFNTP